MWVTYAEQGVDFYTFLPNSSIVRAKNPLHPPPSTQRSGTLDLMYAIVFQCICSNFGIASEKFGFFVGLLVHLLSYVTM